MTGPDIYPAATDGEWPCMAIYPVGVGVAFRCTRPEGHDGPHAAHGVDLLTQLAVWS